MKFAEKKEMQATAVEAAKAAGAIMLRNHFAAKKINESTQRDIKLELDVKCQQKIESMRPGCIRRWRFSARKGTLVISRLTCAGSSIIDGTVNYTYGIPHACVSIAAAALGQAECCSG